MRHFGAKKLGPKCPMSEVSGYPVMTAHDLPDTSDLRHFGLGPKTELLRHFGPRFEVSVGHFGPTDVGPKCPTSVGPKCLKNWVRSVSRPDI